MKKKAILSLAFAAALGGVCAEASAQVYGDTAKVLSATPIRLPSRDCGNEAAKGLEPLGRPAGPDLGSPYRQIAWRGIADTGEPPVPVPKSAPCEKERIVGYEVRYEYNGREFRARMPYDPGKEMPVNVEVRPPMAPSSLAPRPPQYRGTY